MLGMRRRVPVIHFIAWFPDDIYEVSALVTSWRLIWKFRLNLTPDLTILGKLWPRNVI